MQFILRNRMALVELEDFRASLCKRGITFYETSSKEWLAVADEDNVRDIPGLMVRKPDCPIFPSIPPFQQPVGFSSGDCSIIALSNESSFRDHMRCNHLIGLFGHDIDRGALLKRYFLRHVTINEDSRFDFRQNIYNQIEAHRKVLKIYGVRFPSSYHMHMRGSTCDLVSVVENGNDFSISFH